MAELAIDFGTSNSAAGALVDGEPRVLELETGKLTLPTALFFDFEDRNVSYGTDAEHALFEGAWGRYMRALKSLLGTSLIRESGNFLGKRTSYLEIVARFLAEVKARAEAQTGELYSKALSGRPVRFHHDAGRDARAAQDLAEAYALAGFQAVRFMNEPEAAARAATGGLAKDALGLVVDIGGGTSDFTLFRALGGMKIEILQSTGLRLGGTDFDRMISVDHVMPLAGRGSAIRHTFGNETHIAPNAVFTDLATWQKIPFLYTPDTRRMAKDLHRYAMEPEKLARLVRVLEDERGHDLAFAVEAVKIDLNSSGVSAAAVDLSALETGFSHTLQGAQINDTLAQAAASIATNALNCVDEAGFAPRDVDHIVFVGGSSLMDVVKSGIGKAFPQAKLQDGAALTGIIEGLTASLAG